MSLLYTFLVLIGGTLIALFMKYQFNLSDETTVAIQLGSWVLVILIMGVLLFMEEFRYR